MNAENKYLLQVSKEFGVVKHFKKVQESYTSEINMALYIDLDFIQKLKIFQVINESSRNDFVICFYGFRMNLNDRQLENLYKLFIREIDPLIRQENKKKYTVLLFDCPSERKNKFQIIKDFYKRLPIIYFMKLNKIYDIEPQFSTRNFGLISFTAWSKFFCQHAVLLDNVKNVQQISELKIYNVLCKCPKQITKDIKIEFQTPKYMKSAFVGTMKPKPFDCLKKELSQYILDQKRGVPLLLSILIETMKNDKNCCLKQGIFRKAGSIQDEQQIIKIAIEFQSFRLLASQQHCKTAISGVIKKIFTSSTTPLISYNIYNWILHETIAQEQLVGYWKEILSKLPRLNRQTLCYVTEFLRDYILINKDQNSMNAHNLSVVFTPCFFRSKQCCLSDLINSGKFAALFKGLLQEYNQIVENNQIVEKNQLLFPPQNQQSCRQQYFPFQRSRGHCQKLNFEQKWTQQASHSFKY